MIVRAAPTDDAPDAVSAPSPASGLDVGAVLARNTLWNYFGFAVNLAVNFALFPYAVRRLGTGPAGVWLLLGSVTGYMGLLELGIVPALMQRIASALGKDNRAALNETVSTAVVLMTGMMLLGLQFVWFAPAIAGWLQLPAGFSGQAVTAIALAIAGVSLRMPLAPFQAVLLGCQRQDRCNQLWIVLALTKALAIVVLVTLGVGVVGLVAMEAIAHLAAGGLQIYWVRRELPMLRLGILNVRARHAIDLLSFGIPVTLAGIAVLIVEQTDKLVIGASLPIEQVTLYSAAWKLYVLAYSVPTILIQALSPVLAHLHGAGESGRLRTAFFRMTKYSGALALPMAASLGMSAGWILDFWMGPSFAGVYPVVAVLVCGFAVTSLNHAGHSVLFATNRVHRRLWVYDAPQALLNLALSLCLVRPLGIVGVALGTLIPALLMQYGFLRLLSASIGVTWVEWRRVVASTVIPCVIAFTPTLIVRITQGPYSAAVFVGSVLSSAAYLAWFWYRGLDDDERAWLMRRVPALRVLRRARAVSTAGARI
jgi:O-antigen/teichoic acid export membrane protein